MKKALEWVISRGTKDYIYLSGPMTGYPKLNRPLFLKMANRLRKRGYKVINPAEFSDGLWSTCLTRDLILMLLFCNKIAVLPKWKKSKGALLETHVGAQLGMPIHKIEYWLGRGA